MAKQPRRAAAEQSVRSRGAPGVTGDLAGQAADAAKAVGATKAARTIQKAVAPSGPDGGRDDRTDRHGAIREKALKKLDTQYFGRPDDLRELLPLYAARHPDEFRRR